MAGWGQRQDRGAGSTGQIELAHQALDRLGVKGGTLAVRVLEMVGMIGEPVPIDGESGECVAVQFGAGSKMVSGYAPPFRQVLREPPNGAYL